MGEKLEGKKFGSNPKVFCRGFFFFVLDSKWKNEFQTASTLNA